MGVKNLKRLQAKIYEDYDDGKLSEEEAQERLEVIELGADGTFDDSEFEEGPKCV